MASGFGAPGIHHNQIDPTIDQIIPLSAGDTIQEGRCCVLCLLDERAMARVWLAQRLFFGSRKVAVSEARAGLVPELVQEVRLPTPM
jgi:hypothetical protein